MMYKVFEIDKCFEGYASDTILVGGKSVQDILDHFDDIFPPHVETLKREDWVSDEQWEEMTEFGKYKEGDTIVEPFFTDEQMEEFKESLRPDNHWPRIKKIKHLFTDEPYKYITGYGFIE